MFTATETNTTPEVRPLAPSRRGALGFGLAATLAGLTTPAIAAADFAKPPPLPWRNGPRPSDDKDAELIALCDHLVENEYRIWALYSGPGSLGNPEADPVVGPQLEACDRAWLGSRNQVMRMVPTTLEGARAMARLALVQVDDKDINYRPVIDDPRARPLIAIAAWLAEDTALLRDLAAGSERATPVVLPGWNGMTPPECFEARGEAA